MIYHCCDQLRRNTTTLNGIDYIEIIDGDLSSSDPLRQRTLLVHCLQPLPALFSANNLQLLGGERIKNIQIEWAAPAQPPPIQLSAPFAPDTKAAEMNTLNIVEALPDPTSVLVVRTAVAGDFSTYTLQFVKSALDDSPPDGFDPQLVTIDFSFKVECPTDIDCQPQRYCPPGNNSEPEIDYLAKDYSSFRRLLLDRITQLVPQWQQSSSADYGIALTELLAYAADQLSYQQDAIATEAYLGTARKRVSLRRHAVLVDYPMHDGCNARTWLHLKISQISPAIFMLPLADTRFLTRCPGLNTEIAANSAQLDAAMQCAPLVFEPLLDLRYKPDFQQPLYAAHNKIGFYTWSNQRCCLPKGSTQATLIGSYPNLQVGDVLLFEEVKGPNTGWPGDADPLHRHVVRLTAISPTAPATLTDPVTNDSITEIEWASDDALPFVLCISGYTDPAHGSLYQDSISVARGNVVLVDHGQKIPKEHLATVPPTTQYLIAAGNTDHCIPDPSVAVAPRYRPQLGQTPLTQAAGRFYTSTISGNTQIYGTTLDAALSLAPASQSLDWNMTDVLPQALLDQSGSQWKVQPTLLNSGANDADFVIEVDDDGGALLRFGDDQHGLRPEPGTAFTTVYRIGNGSAGNVGANSIYHIVSSAANLSNVTALSNPLPARGGVDPEDMESVRRNAPVAFRTQERAVTTDDYAAVTERDPRVLRAAASLRWTGSWHSVYITVDPLAGIDDVPLKGDLHTFVDRYRMAGHDLEFNNPHYVSLEIDLTVCIQNDYFRSDVKNRLLQILSNKVLADGSRGLFHPDNFSFAQTVYLSPLYAAAHQVPGIAAVEVTVFQRQGTDDPGYLRSGSLPLGRLEIARLDNDPDFPEHGILRLTLKGGK